MVETVANWLALHASHAPFFVFGLLLLTGFSFPVSEDIIVIASGVLASTVIPEKKTALFVAVIVGSCLSDWVAYWIGRGLGGKMLNIRWFRKSFSEGRRDVVARFFERYGFLTLFIGRMIPFGVRNTVFMAAGAGKMPFLRFLLSDGIGCVIFSSVVFFVAVRCGETYDQLHTFVSSIGYLFGLGLLISALAWYIWSRVAREQVDSSAQP